jgi:outer membrane protein
MGRRRVVAIVVTACMASRAMALTVDDRLLDAYGERAQSSAAQGLTIEESFARALAVNPAVAAARQQLAVSKHGLALARAAYYPQLNASLSGQRAGQKLDETDEAKDRVLNQITTYNANVLTASVSSTLNLFRGGQDTANVKIAKQLIEQNRERLKSAEQTVLQAVAHSFLLMLDSAERMRMIQTELVGLEKLDAEYQSMARNKLATEADRYLVTVQVENAQSALIQARQDRETAEAQLSLVLGAPVQSSLQTPDLGRYLPSREDIENAIVRNNPDVAAVRSQLAIAKSGVDVAIGQALPSLSLGTAASRSLPTYDYGGNSPLSLPFGPYIARQRLTDWSIGLALSVPLFTGGADTARIRQAYQNAGAAQSTLDTQLLTTRGNFEAAWYEHKALLDRLEVTRRQIDALQIVVEGQTRTNRDGLTSIQDLLRSRQNLLSADLSLSQLQFSLGQTQVQLLALAGLLNSEGLHLAIDNAEPVH